MTNATKSADIGHSLRRTQSMIREAIQQTNDVDYHLKDSTERVKHILGLHQFVQQETKKGKGILKTLGSRAFWDKHLYKIVFIIYLLVVFYIVTKHFGNLFYKIYDWICWTLSWFIFWFPGFGYICPYYSSSSSSLSVPDIDEEMMYNEQFDNLTNNQHQEFMKPEL